MAGYKFQKPAPHGFVRNLDIVIGNVEIELKFENGSAAQD